MASASVMATLARIPEPSTSKIPGGPAEHDSEYYFEDELSIFMVENRLFKVHRHFLTRDSEFFRGLFACPAPPGEDVEGRNDGKPIALYGVTVHEFRCLLRFFYNGMYRPAISTLDDWIALLSIATRYVFDHARALAIAELSQRMLEPVRKIALAHTYHVPQWLPAAFGELIRRPEPLTDAEADALGLRTVVRVARARELARDRGYVTTALRSYFPYDKIYSFNDKGIMQVFNNVWPECAGMQEPPAEMALPA